MLPIVDGAEHLRFRCTGCGACCRALRVTITHHDLRRLSEYLRQPASTLVEWLGPGEVDMTGEPETFVELREGRRLMVLAQAEGACRLLDENQRCRAYPARPRDCELFPFNLEREPRGDRYALTLLALDGCDYARDGATDAAHLGAADTRRWRELSEYRDRVGRWNRLARHRARLHYPQGDANEFLAFLLPPEGHGSALSG